MRSLRWLPLPFALLAALVLSPTALAGDSAGLDPPLPSDSGRGYESSLRYDFGQRGWAHVNGPGLEQAISQSAVTLPNGSVVVAGLTNESRSNILLAKLTAAGKVKNGFLKRSQQFRLAGASGNALAVQPDGKILVAGQRSSNTGVEQFVARFHSNGKADRSFGSNGHVSRPSGRGGAVAIRVQGSRNDFRILTLAQSVAQDAPAQYQLTGFKKGGKKDRSFGSRGVALSSWPAQSASGDLIGSVGVDFLVRSDGSLLVGGSLDRGNQYPAFAAFTSAGQPDVSFGDQGQIEINDVDGTVGQLAMSGSNTVASVSAWSQSRTVHVLRIGPQGRLDPTFGQGGIATRKNKRLPKAGDDVYGFGTAVLSGGRVVVLAPKVMLGFTSAGEISRKFGKRGILPISGLRKPNIVRFAEPKRAGSLLVVGGDKTGAVVGAYR